MKKIGVLNTTARQFNLRNLGPGKKVTTIRLNPGLNSVPEDVWGRFSQNKFLLERMQQGEIVHGEAISDRLKTETPELETKIKEESRIPTMKSEVPVEQGVPAL